MPRLVRIAAPPTIGKPPRWNLSQGFVHPKWQPFWRDLVFIAPFWEGSALPYVWIGGQWVRTTQALGSTPWRAGFGGHAIDLDGDRLEAVAVNTAVDRELAGNTRGASIAAAGFFEDSGSATTSQRIWSTDTADTFHAGLALGYDDIDLRVEFRISDGSTLRQAFTATNSVPDGSYGVMGGTWAGSGNGLVAWWNGVPGSASANQTSIRSDPITNDITIGDRASGDRTLLGRLEVIYVWARGLTNREMVQISADPFGPIRPFRYSATDADARPLPRILLRW